jgi:hypothetical protein
MNFKKFVFWYKNSLVDSELYVVGSIKEYKDFTSYKKLFLGDTVKLLGIEIDPDLLRKKTLYRYSRFDKISKRVDSV